MKNKPENEQIKNNKIKKTKSETKRKNDKINTGPTTRSLHTRS